MPQYLKISISCYAASTEILIAEMAAIHFDSFLETETGLDAFIIEEFYDKNLLDNLFEKYGIRTTIKVERLENINWNEEWENNFEPVIIDEKVQIRATFHKPQTKIKHDVIINPKMSFGTGHHETTHLIVAEQLTIDHKEKQILDVGTGTGILAIMAFKLGAKSIVATDTDAWCIENCKENFDLNQVENFEILQGSIDKLTLPGPFDVIYANINKIVLMDELPHYKKLLAENGIIVLSGFYSYDEDDLRRKAISCNLTLVHTNIRNNWAMMRLIPAPI